jgi:putative DNA primase/helicase
MFVKKYGDQVINVSGSSGRTRGNANWHIFDGTRWKPDGDAILSRATALTDDIVASATQSGDKDAVEKAIACRSQQRIERSLLLAQADPGVRRRAADLDRDPYLLNCQNGTVDLRTGEMRPHDPKDLITKAAAASFDAEARAPKWDDFLDLACDGNGELVEYLQRAAGWSLIGDPERRAAIMLVGAGFNGKTTFLDTLGVVLGEYARTAHPSLLLRKRLAAETELDPSLVGLRGARFVVMSETDAKGQLSPAKLKQLTGGGSVSARGLYQNPIEFRPVFKLWVDTNVLPDVSETDKATRDRIVVVPFTVNLEATLAALGRRERKNFAAELREEAEGILAWAVRGCLSYQRHGLPKPAAVEAATKAYWKDQDRVGQFLEERCAPEPGVRTMPSELYNPYRDWTLRRGEKPLNNSHFNAKLSEKGFERRTYNGQVYWIGIGPKIGSASAAGAAPPLGKLPQYDAD